MPVALMAMACLLPVALNGYLVYLAGLALVYVIVAVGFTIILGWSGQLAFMSAAFFGLGAYAGGAAAAWGGAPAELALIAGGAAGVLLGSAFGALAVRLRRYYLAIATLSLMYVLDYCYRNFPAWTGGVSGFPVPQPAFLLLLGREVATDYGKYYVGLALALLAYLSARSGQTTSLGRAWRVIRSDERVAMSLGIDVYRGKLSAFAISAGFLGLAGAWFVFLTGRFLPETFGLNELLFDFVILVVGGLGSLNGAVIGAVILVLAREYLRTFPGISELLFGLVLLATVLFLPRGIYGTPAARFRWLREGVV
jgi:branched-chain amino acid transport system permease protein